MLEKICTFCNCTVAIWWVPLWKGPICWTLSDSKIIFLSSSLYCNGNVINKMAIWSIFALNVFQLVAQIRHRYHSAKKVMYKILSSYKGWCLKMTVLDVVCKWNILYFLWNLSKICCQWPIWLYVIIDSGDGLAPNRCQAIINDDLVDWVIYACPDLNVLKCPGVNLVISCHQRNSFLTYIIWDYGMD